MFKYTVCKYEYAAVLHSSWQLSWYYYPVVFDSGLTSIRLAHRLWVNSSVRRGLMSRPRCSLLGQLWLQFHWLTRRVQTHCIVLIWIMSSVSLTPWQESVESGSPYWSLNTALLTFPVRIAWGSVSSWLAPVLLWSAQFLYIYQASTSVSHKGSYQIHLIKQSYYEEVNAMLNKGRDLNAQLYWLSHTSTQLPKYASHKGPYLKISCCECSLTLSHCLLC